jgi:hypothetical protein
VLATAGARARAHATASVALHKRHLYIDVGRSRAAVFNMAYSSSQPLLLSPMDVACVWSSFRCSTSMCDAQFLCSEPVEASWQRDSSQTGDMLLHRRARRLQSMPSLHVRLTIRADAFLLQSRRAAPPIKLRPRRRSAFHGRRWSPPILASAKLFRAAQALSIDASNPLANHTH